MKKSFVLFLFVFLGLCYGISYCAEDRKELKPKPSPEELQKIRQDMQPPRPILPPVVSPGPSGVSPTFSPHITAPQIPTQVINTQLPSGPQIPQPSMHNIPSVPTYATAPTVPVPTELPQVPIIGNAIGKVVGMGSEKDGTPWIEVNDNLFGETVRIKIRNLERTPITSHARIMSFRDIKIGGAVNVIFTNENEENIASFINILSEEELEMFNENAQPRLTATSEESGNASKPSQ